VTGPSHNVDGVEAGTLNACTIRNQYVNVETRGRVSLLPYFRSTLANSRLSPKDREVLKEAYQKNRNPMENDLRGIVMQTSMEMHQVIVRTPFHDNEETKNKAEVVRKSKIQRSTKD
jgi:hypothetical protein